MIASLRENINPWIKNKILHKQEHSLYNKTKTMEILKKIKYKKTKTQ